MVQLDNIVKTYNKGKSNAFEALHGISLTIEDGEMVAIMEPQELENPPYYIYLLVLMDTIRESIVLMT